MALLGRAHPQCAVGTRSFTLVSLCVLGMAACLQQGECPLACHPSSSEKFSWLPLTVLGRSHREVGRGRTHCWV